MFSGIERAIENITPDINLGPRFYQENKKLDKRRVDAGLIKEYIYFDDVSKISVVKKTVDNDIIPC